MSLDNDQNDDYFEEDDPYERILLRDLSKQEIATLKQYKKEVVALNKVEDTLLPILYEYQKATTALQLKYMREVIPLKAVFMEHNISADEALSKFWGIVEKTVDFGIADLEVDMGDLKLYKVAYEDSDESMLKFNKPQITEDIPEWWKKLWGITEE